MDVLQSRVNGYVALIKSLDTTKQSGALDILLKDIPLNFLQSFQIDLNGKYMRLGSLLGEPQAQNIWKTLSVFERVNLVVSNLEKKIFKLVNNIIPPRVSHYIPRTLSKRLRLNTNIFIQNCPDAFVIDGMDRPMLTKIARGQKTASSRNLTDEVTVKFIQLENRAHWNDIRDLASAPVHLLSYNAAENILVLEETSGGSKILPHFLERQNLDEGPVLTEKNLKTDTENQSAICICDLPGMGKTLLLASLAQHVTQNLNSFPAYIRLQHFIQSTKYGTIKETDFLINCKFKLFEYIAKSVVGASILIEAVNSYKLRVEIFFDEFEEIDKHDLFYAKAFLKSISIEPNI